MKKPCNHPGCPSLIDDGRFCLVHRSKADLVSRDYERRRSGTSHLREAKRIRSTAAWQRIRAIKLAQTPLCEDPFSRHAKGGRTETAREVHHIEPLAIKPELAYVLENLMSVCIGCHATLGQAERVVKM